MRPTVTELAEVLANFYKELGVLRFENIIALGLSFDFSNKMAIKQLIGIFRRSHIDFEKFHYSEAMTTQLIRSFSGLNEMSFQEFHEDRVLFKKAFLHVLAEAYIHFKTGGAYCADLVQRLTVLIINVEAVFESKITHDEACNIAVSCLIMQTVKYFNRKTNPEISKQYQQTLVQNQSNESVFSPVKEVQISTSQFFVQAKAFATSVSNKTKAIVECMNACINHAPERAIDILYPQLTAENLPENRHLREGLRRFYLLTVGYTPNPEIFAQQLTFDQAQTHQAIEDHSESLAVSL